MEQKRYYHALTSLKGIFILVIAFHNTQLIQPLFENVPGVSIILLYGGVFGNSMFFILSGFLLAISYRDKIRTHTVTFRDFLVKRLKKLYPLYFISNAVTLVLEILLYGPSAVNLKKVAFTFLLQLGGSMENANPYNAPTWFLSAVFICYIAFFAICFFTKNATQYSCSIALGIIWGYTLIGLNQNIPFCNQGTGVAFMNFFIGCALAEALPLLDRKCHRWLPTSSLIALVLSAYLCVRYGFEVICGDVQAAASFVICPLILYLAFTDGPCEKLLRLKPFVSLGNISISIFFWHLVIYRIFSALFCLIFPGQEIREPQYILYFIVMLTFSMLSHRFLEQRKAA